MSSPSREVVERFFGFVMPMRCGCWLWTGPRSRGKGNRAWYGTFSPSKRGVRAHIWAHDVLAGKHHRKGWHRDHICGNTLCVNPLHIVSISRSDNQKLKIARGYSQEQKEWARQQVDAWAHGMITTELTGP